LREPKFKNQTQWESQWRGNRTEGKKRATGQKRFQRKHSTEFDNQRVFKNENRVNQSLQHSKVSSRLCVLKRKNLSDQTKATPFPWSQRRNSRGWQSPEP